MPNLLSTQAIELPNELANQLNAEAKRSRKSVPAMIAQWLEDQNDGREAAKRLKAHESGKTKPIPATQVYAKLGL